MKKTRVAFMGSRPLGHYALTMLQSMSQIEVVAVVAKEPPSSAWWDKDPFHIAEHPIRSHSDLHNIEFDFGISINYWKIIEPELIRIPRLGFINLHHSYNLCLRGRNMTSHAIIEARKLARWYHGTSLHYTDDGLDTGPIIASKACDLTEKDTSWTLFQKVEALGKDLLKEWLPRLSQAKAPAAHPTAGHPVSLKIQEDDKFISDIHSDPIHTYDFVRAFDFNGHYPFAFTKFDGKKVELTTDQNFGDAIVLDAGSGRIVYATRKSH